MTRHFLAVLGILTISNSPALCKAPDKFLQDGTDKFVISAGMPAAPAPIAPSSSQTSSGSSTAPSSSMPSLRGPAVSPSAQDVQNLLTGPKSGQMTLLRLDK